MTLKGYTDNNNAYEYILFGRFPQSYLGGDLSTEPAGVESEDWVKAANQGPHYPGVATLYFSIDPIRWRVLGSTSAGLLVLSDKILDQREFHGDWTPNDYGVSTMRKYLSGGDAATDGVSGGWLDGDEPYFSAAEQEAMALYTYGSYKDKLFLLSWGAADADSLQNTGFGFTVGGDTDQNRIGCNTHYRCRLESVNGPDAAGEWWTRSPGFDPFRVLAVERDGSLVARDIVNFLLGVRPAFFLKPVSLIFKSASDDFGPGSVPASPPGGQDSNPWIPVLDGMAPADWTGWTVKFASADRIPAGAAIDATGTKMTVSWDAAISPAVKRWPAPADFTLTRPGNVTSHPVSVTSDDADDKLLILTFATAARKGEAMTLGYNLDTDAISYDHGGGSPKNVINSFTLSASLITNNSTVAPDPGPDPDPVPEPDPDPIPVTGVTLDRDSLFLKSGDAPVTLKATVAPADAANKKVTWTSGNPNAATVDANGKVTPVGPGTAIITVTTEDGKKTDTCAVTVSAPTVIAIDLSGLGLVDGKLELQPGQEVDLTVTGTPAGLKYKAAGLPDGLTLTEDGRLFGKVPQPGTYPVTLTVAAPDGTEKTFGFTIMVTEDEVIVKDNGGSGGCNATGAGMAAVALCIVLLRRRRSKL